MKGLYYLNQVNQIESHNSLKLSFTNIRGFFLKTTDQPTTYQPTNQSPTTDQPITDQ